MKAISIYPEYAMDIADGYKDREYRTWKTNYRGDLLICSTKGHAVKGSIPGHAICVVDLYDIRKLKDGTYEWLLRDARLIKPIPVRGQQGLFNVDEELEFCPEFESDDDQIKWENENFTPFIKGAYINSKNEWVIPTQDGYDKIIVPIT